jgi:hypothetical protein
MAQLVGKSPTSEDYGAADTGVQQWGSGVMHQQLTAFGFEEYRCEPGPE